jgi:uncharacterized protein YjeT (DUF2065 family)
MPELDGQAKILEAQKIVFEKQRQAVILLETNPSRRLSVAPYIDAWFALTLVIIGLSHAAQPRLWADFFVMLKRTGFAPLIIGMYYLPTGLVILLGHNLWVWDWPVFVTIFGWGMTIKATIYLIFPAVPNRMIGNADRWQVAFSAFRVVGIVMSVLGAVLTWHAFRHLPV